MVEVAATERERGVRRGLKVRAKREENSLAVWRDCEAWKDDGQEALALILRQRERTK